MGGSSQIKDGAIYGYLHPPAWLLLFHPGPLSGYGMELPGTTAVSAQGGPGYPIPTDRAYSSVPYETPRGARQPPTEAPMALSVCDLGDGAKPLVTWSEITKRPGGVYPLARGKIFYVVV